MDLTEGNALVVRYRRMEFIIIEDDGKEQTVPIDNGGTFQIESPCHRAETRFPEEQRVRARYAACATGCEVHFLDSQSVRNRAEIEHHREVA